MQDADFFAVADSIGPEGWEPGDRSAVSRMYYGVHHEARRFITRRRGVTDFMAGWHAQQQRPLGAHEYVIAILDQIEPNIGEALDELRRLRVHADYLLEEPWNPQTRAQTRAEVRRLRQFFGAV
jgi:hypothetical protein